MWRVMAGCAALMLTAACSASDPRSPDTVPDSIAGDKTTSDVAKRLAQQMRAEDYDRSLFDSDAMDVDNRWYPLNPGTRLVYDGLSLEDEGRVKHTVISVVTDLVKEIDGVPNAVVWERDFIEGELVEAELAMFAEDRYRNVWHMGEYPEEYEDGEIDKAPAWVHGIARATAGITIPGDPVLGTPDFAEGYAPPPINWVDRGQVYRTRQTTTVEAGIYHDVVVIQEFETDVEDAYQDKYYAPGVGVVYVGWRGANDDSKETLELTQVALLDSRQLAAARKSALALEKRAYAGNDAYRQTEPAHRIW
jgi:hypothetical protein